MQTAATAQKVNNAAPVIVSIHVILGQISLCRAASSPSMARPAIHQNKIPTTGQLIARHNLKFMPRGIHSCFVGFRIMYGSN